MSGCDRVASVMRPWPTGGYCVVDEIYSLDKSVGFRTTFWKAKEMYVEAHRIVKSNYFKWPLLVHPHTAKLATIRLCTLTRVYRSQHKVTVIKATVVHNFTEKH